MWKHWGIPEIRAQTSSGVLGLASKPWDSKWKDYFQHLLRRKERLEDQTFQWQGASSQLCLHFYCEFNTLHARQGVHAVRDQNWCLHLNLCSLDEILETQEESDHSTKKLQRRPSVLGNPPLLFNYSHPRRHRQTRFYLDRYCEFPHWRTIFQPTTLPNFKTSYKATISKPGWHQHKDRLRDCETD